MQYQNNDAGCLGCGIIILIYLLWAAFVFTFIGGLIWLTIYLLQQAGAI